MFFIHLGLFGLLYQKNSYFTLLYLQGRYWEGDRGQSLEVWRVRKRVRGVQNNNHPVRKQENYFAEVYKRE